MKKKRYIQILLAFLIVLFSLDAFAQAKVNYLHLKQFFREYEAALQGLAPRDPDAMVGVNEHRFAQLFYNESVPIYNFIQGVGPEQTTVKEFLEATRDFRKDNFLITDSRFFYIDNFEIIREMKNGLVTIKINQQITFREHYGTNFSRFNDELYFTILYTKRQDFKILKIDRADFAFTDGLGSCALIPSSLEFQTALSQTSLSNDSYENNSGFHPGLDLSLQLNYPIWGKNNYNLMFSTGFMYSRFNTSIFDHDLNYQSNIPADIDGQPFELILSGEHFGHDVSISYAGIPIKFNNIWQIKKNQLSLNLGVDYLFAIGSEYNLNEGALRYQGLYLFPGYESYPVLLYDLPEYGFKTYNYDEFEATYAPDLNNLIVGNFDLKYAFQLTEKFKLSAGPSVRYAFNNVINAQGQPPLINRSEVMSPNLLAYGDNNSMFKLGFSISLTYQLKRPNIPYRSNVGYFEVKNDFSKLRKRDLDQQHPPINIYLINSYSRFMAGKDFNRNKFADAVAEIIGRKVYDQRQDLVAYVAFDDTLFERKETFEMIKLRQIVYEPLSEGHYQTTQDFENFATALQNIPLTGRVINLHIILASPYSYEDSKRLIELFARRFLGDNYRFANFYIYTPVLKFHEARSRSLLEEDDKMLERLINTLETRPTTPYDFDYNYERISID